MNHFNIIMAVGGEYLVVYADRENLAGHLKVICDAMHAAHNGRPSYICQFNMVSKDEPLWQCCVKSEQINGYYVKSMETREPWQGDEE